ncbi:MAG TPA: zf-HC2 domain-containing protein [Bryobacteraceae bacterium]|jgi:anti-sigma factor RsiW|nr:zf-HC2 domain-containing protein [Bryobacteraceae bacterium]
MSTCDRSEELRDYAFDELPAAAQTAVEQHIAACHDCAAELDSLRLTTAALRILPDREIPQRIAFVSDKVFEPSAAARFFAGFWNSASKLGFASACILAVGLVASASLQYNKPSTPVQAIAQPAKFDVAAQVNAQINEAVTKAVAQVRAEDTKVIQTALAESEQKHDQERRALMAAVAENFDVLQKRYNTRTLFASTDLPREGGQ